MENNKQQIRISVVVCTYNRAHLLPFCLKSLIKQTLDKNLYEVVIVDNNSTDWTRTVCESFCARYSNIHYCLETQVGLSHARNRGYREAQGEYVAYLDDDAKTPKQWLSVAVEVIEHQSPAAFGGPYYPFYDSPKPYWFKDAYGTAEMAESARVLARNSPLSGGNLFIKRKALEELGGFDNSFGMTGSRIAYGEEGDLLRRLWARTSDAAIYYEPRLFIYHLVKANKMTVRWVFRRSFVSGRCHYATQLRYQVSVNTPWMLIKTTLAVFREFAYFWLQYFSKQKRARYPYLRNFLYEVPPRCLWILGIIYEQCRTVTKKTPNLK